MDIESNQSSQVRLAQTVEAEPAHPMSASLFKRGWARYRLLFQLGFVFFVISFLTRVALMVKAGSAVEPSLIQLIGALFVGTLSDAVAASYFFVPLVLILSFTPDHIFRTRGYAALLLLGSAVYIFLMLFNAVAEWTFWAEFSSRYNFVAVDYLVYSHEVIGNIRESYPVGWILGALALVSAIITCWVGRRIFSQTPVRTTWRERLPYMVALLALPGLAFVGVDSRAKDFSDNRYVNELAGNGIYSFFAAFYNNELDYDRFYRHIPIETAFAQVRGALQTPHAQLASAGAFDLTRNVSYPGAERRLNVVLISVESLSAAFLERFGNTDNLTPNLNALAHEGLMFTNLYATGTRTVRGLEALSISLPPTPGQSIVKRPHNDGIDSLGSVFRAKGYDTRFIYGGYGYFDNMNAFFGANDYDIVDRTSIAAENVHAENIWGVADEDLFGKSLEVIDASFEAGKPSFSHIMTTSNHRPYTYPDGRIDIPSHTGRSGGVKYTDWAIGDFIARAKSRPWFKNTLFVIVADHCADSAGKSDLPVERYHIPALFYAPDHIKPSEYPRLASQIDIVPTILGQLNMSYQSHFLGYDLFDLPAGRERAFMGTYQLLGYLKDGALTILDSHANARVSNAADPIGKATPPDGAQERITEAISWYQVSAYAFDHRLLKNHL